MTTEKKTTEKKTTDAAEDKKGLSYEIITDLEELQKLIKAAIDKGATNVEEVHMAIAKLPLSYLKKISKIKSLTEKAGTKVEKTIGYTYNLIRTINEKSSDITLKILGKMK